MVFVYLVGIVVGEIWRACSRKIHEQGGFKLNLTTASSIYRVHFLKSITILIYGDTIDRVLFYIKMTDMMSDISHRVLKILCLAMGDFCDFRRLGIK